MSALVQELAPSGGWLRGPRGVLLASAILGAALAGTLFATFGPEPAPANSESQPDVLAAGTHETTPGALAEAYEFLTRNVEGKRFEKSWTTAVVEEGRLEADSRDVEFIHDVVLEGNRLTFRRTIEAEQFNYRLDESGERIFPGEPVDRSGTRQYAFSLRQETGAILGVSFPMHASGWEESLRLTVENDRLIITGKSATEFDRAFTGDGEWKPAVFRFTHTWKRTGERVEKRLLMYGYDYDTERHAAADEPYMTLNITLQEQK